jgi:hypothetical protein
MEPYHFRLWATTDHYLNTLEMELQHVRRSRQNIMKREACLSTSAIAVFACQGRNKSWIATLKISWLRIYWASLFRKIKCIRLCRLRTQKTYIGRFTFVVFKKERKIKYTNNLIGKKEEVYANSMHTSEAVSLFLCKQKKKKSTPALSRNILLWADKNNFEGMMTREEHTQYPSSTSKTKSWSQQTKPLDK